MDSSALVLVPCQQPADSSLLRVRHPSSSSVRSAGSTVAVWESMIDSLDGRHDWRVAPRSILGATPVKLRVKGRRRGAFAKGVRKTLQEDATDGRSVLCKDKARKLAGGVYPTVNGLGL